MSLASTCTFHIVYTPGTVRRLVLFLPSLLRWSTASFRLVSNGCSLEEQLLLQRLCAGEPRLEFLAFPTPQMRLHGDVLNDLFARCDDDRFCFMDSDIFAVGPCLDDLVAASQRAAGVFSAPPVWALPSDTVLPLSFMGVFGEYSTTADGGCLGNTYLAVYDRRALADVMPLSGSGFHDRTWTALTAQAQQLMADAGWVGRHFDTGKLLNLLLRRCHRLEVVSEPALRHIGGTSFAALGQSAAVSWTSRVAEWLAASPLRTGVERVQMHRAIGGYRRRFPEHEARVLALRRTRQRNPARAYLLAVVDAVVNNSPPPRFRPTGIQELDHRLRQMADDIAALGVTRDEVAS